MPDFLGHKIIDVTFESIINQTVQRSLNYKTIVSAHNAQYWKFFITLRLSAHVTPENAVASFAQVSGMGYDTFEFPVPQAPYRGSQTAFAGSGAKDATTVSVSGGEHIPVGRFVTFGSHKKLYAVTAASGGSISVFPRLQMRVSGAINIDPVMQAMYEGISTLVFSGGVGVPTIQMAEVL